MTTPAEELRTAAEKLRAYATAAAEDSGSATWHAARHFPDQPDSGFTALWATGAQPLLRGGGGRGRPPAYVHAPVGDYIAAMDPGVGTALAAWLEQAAEALTGTDVPDHEPALAVARAINGTDR